MNVATCISSTRLQRDLNVPDEKLNVNGGAIALGHPLVTAQMILGTLVDELERTQINQPAWQTLYAGGGMGIGKRLWSWCKMENSNDDHINHKCNVVFDL